MARSRAIFVVIRNDGEGNNYCQYGVTAKFCCSSERGAMFSFASEAI